MVSFLEVRNDSMSDLNTFPASHKASSVSMSMKNALLALYEVNNLYMSQKEGFPVLHEDKHC